MLNKISLNNCVCCVIYFDSTFVFPINPITREGFILKTIFIYTLPLISKFLLTQVHLSVFNYAPFVIQVFFYLSQ